MLHLADEDVIPRTDERVAPGISHRVERRRGARREDDLLLFGRPDKGGDPLPGLLVQLRGLLRQEMHAAVNVRVQAPVEVIDRIDHLPGLLRRGSAVEVNQRLTVDLAVQDRKLLPYFLNIKHHYISSIFTEASSMIAPHSGSMPQRPTTSPTNPSICSRRACASLSPR